MTPDPEIEIVPFPETEDGEAPFAALAGDDDTSRAGDAVTDAAAAADAVDADAVPDERSDAPGEDADAVPEVVVEVPEVVAPAGDPLEGAEGGIADEVASEVTAVTEVTGSDAGPPASASATSAQGDAEPEPEPATESESETEPESTGSSVAAPVPGARPGGQLVSRSSSSPAARPAHRPEPISPLRRWAVVTRLQLLAMVAVVAAGVVSLVAVWGVSRIAGTAADLDAAGRSASATGELAALLTAVRADGGDELPARLTRVGSLLEQVRRDAPEGVDAALIDRLERQVDQLVRTVDDSAEGVADPAAFDARAIEATSHAVELSSSLDRRIAVLDDDVESARRTAVIAVLIVLLVAACALVGLTRAVSRSVVGPLRLLGRAMRRFADGDTAARGVEHADEVGLLARSFNYSAEAVGARIERLSADAARGTQLRLVSDALDLADDESDVHRIVSRAFGILAPGQPAELLVHDSTSTRLHQVAVHPVLGAPGCPVDTTSGCVAMRRAQAVTFDGPSAINACPHLRDRDTTCSAACVPVSVNGHLLGVIHVTGAEGRPPAREVVEQLVTFASQVGTRIGAMRTLEVTRMQASTDGLTGLANRRMLEARVGDLVRKATPFVLAVADLDHFTHINNTYGHEAGDRALQLFASVLEDNVRGHDIVARFGGEEFVLVYPEMSVKPSMEAIERIRVALSRAIERAGLPPFTCSFGVTHSSVGDSVEAIIRIADAGLLTAKDLGRNRVVYADEELAAEIFGPTGDEVAPRRSPRRSASPPDEPEAVGPDAG